MKHLNGKTYQYILYKHIYTINVIHLHIVYSIHMYMYYCICTKRFTNWLSDNKKNKKITKSFIHIVKLEPEKNAK